MLFVNTVKKYSEKQPGIFYKNKFNYTKSPKYKDEISNEDTIIKLTEIRPAFHNIYNFFSMECSF